MGHVAEKLGLNNKINKDKRKQVIHMMTELLKFVCLHSEEEMKESQTKS